MILLIFLTDNLAKNRWRYAGVLACRHQSGLRKAVIFALRREFLTIQLRVAKF